MVCRDAALPIAIPLLIGAGPSLSGPRQHSQLRRGGGYFSRGLCLPAGPGLPPSAAPFG